MKRILSTLFIISVIFQLSAGQDIINIKSITGSWMGKISVGAASLRVVFNLSLVEKDSLVATLDSPDQGAKNIKIGPVSFDGKAITIKAPMLLGEYNGTLKNDTLFEGTWKQAGRINDLNLIKLKAAFALNRPQEPKPPFPYLSEDVTFKNSKFKISLGGTLTIPEGKGPFPAVILITGSGSQNRNEELMGHKPFWVIADCLTRNGIAVLRYDDRGVGKSQGTPLNVTTADLSTDAESAFLYLKTRPEINLKAIGLTGHSEGGMIAPMVASLNSEVAFIISLAGPGVCGEQILNRQNKDINLLSGADKKRVQEGISTNKKLFKVLKKESDNKIAEDQINKVYKKILIRKKTSPEEIDKEIKQLNASMNPVSYNWLRYFIVTNPADFWKKVKCPVLALNGEKDLQVAFDVNLPAIEKAVKSGGNHSIKTISFPDLNHLFQHCKTGLPKEYGEIEMTFSPEVLKIISDWIHQLKL